MSHLEHMKGHVCCFQVIAEPHMAPPRVPWNNGKRAKFDGAIELAGKRENADKNLHNISLNHALYPRWSREDEIMVYKRQAIQID